MINTKIGLYIIAAFMLGLVVSTAARVVADSPNSQLIRACVSKGGNIRIVEEGQSCTKNETLLEWWTGKPSGGGYTSVETFDLPLVPIEGDRTTFDPVLVEGLSFTRNTDTVRMLVRFDGDLWTPTCLNNYQFDLVRDGVIVDSISGTDGMVDDHDVFVLQEAVNLTPGEHIWQIQARIQLHFPEEVVFCYPWYLGGTVTLTQIQ